VTKQDPRFPPGRYEHGRRVMPRMLYESDREPPPRPQPRCVTCQTQLVEITVGPDHYWRCGNFPHCRFRISDAVIQEAVRRQIAKLNTAAVQ
jgi:hypothetical protein